MSVCPSVHPPAFGVASKKCHRLSCVLWNVKRAFPYPFYLYPRVSVLQEAPASIPRGWGKEYVDFFPSLKSCLRFPWLRLK